MQTFNIDDASAQLVQLVELASKGEPFIIARAGKPMVKVIPVDEAAPLGKKQRLGALEGLFTVPDDFDRMGSEEIERMFYGEK